MKVLMINVVCGIKSTGRICTDLADELIRLGHEVMIAYGRENVPVKYEKISKRIGNDFDVNLHGIKSRIFDDSGLNSKLVTLRFVRWIKEYNPDIIHIHNIHGYYINYRILFNYLKTSKKRIIWTLHDCWAMTGHCTFFSFSKCNKWKDHCHNCPQKKSYPSCYLFDHSYYNFKLKKKTFCGIDNLTIVTPSLWLRNLVSQSLLSEYPVVVINNGIDVSVFRKSNESIDDKFLFENKKVILGVAAIWNDRKGLKEFIKLRGLLDEEYIIVLVGLTQKQIDDLPDGIIGIRRTDNVEELAALYNRALYFVNPTFEDNYPTTNIEAIACGTPVISYDTGGSGESAECYGIKVPKGHFELIAEIISENYSFESKKIILSKNETTQKYLDLYNGLKIEDK